MVLLHDVGLAPFVSKLVSEAVRHGAPDLGFDQSRS
jgi:hypothetical protein